MDKEVCMAANLPTMDKLLQLRESIKHLDYVVMRNWHRLPDVIGIEGHEDLDLFVSEECREELSRVISEYDLVDLRSPRDRYYPDYINDLMLKDKRGFGGFNIPSAEAYFLSLYYHATIHKQSNQYDKELRRAFMEWLPPVICTDKGVGFYADH